MALLWRGAGRQETRLLGSYAELLPFTLLCSLAIMAIVWWARRADEHLLRYYGAEVPERSNVATSATMWGTAVRRNDKPHTIGTPSAAIARPRLYGRLSGKFVGTILALESEDHYVRVHGMQSSELVLLRLRDAIAEMDGHAGEQTHRSWWVAREAVARIAGSGRNREIELINGQRSPVARDSIERLIKSGFLPE